MKIIVAPYIYVIYVYMYIYVYISISHSFLSYISLYPRKFDPLQDPHHGEESPQGAAKKWRRCLGRGADSGAVVLWRGQKWGNQLSGLIISHIIYIYVIYIYKCVIYNK